MIEKKVVLKTGMLEVRIELCTNEGQNKRILKGSTVVNCTRIENNFYFYIFHKMK